MTLTMGQLRKPTPDIKAQLAERGRELFELALDCGHNVGPEDIFIVGWRLLRHLVNRSTLLLISAVPAIRILNVGRLFGNNGTAKDVVSKEPLFRDI